MEQAQWRVPKRKNNNIRNIYYSFGTCVRVNEWMCVYVSSWEHSTWQAIFSVYMVNSNEKRIVAKDGQQCE